MAGAQEVASDIHSRACVSMSEILLERASNIIEIAQKDKKMIHVLWSGGIDTTAVIVSFLRRIEERGLNPDCIIATYCERSIQEYPLFYE